MRLFLIGSLLILSACSERTVTHLKIPEVPAKLRTPCQVQERPYGTLNDVGLILTDHVEALDCANGKIGAIDKILKTAEQAKPVKSK